MKEKKKWKSESLIIVYFILNLLALMGQYMSMVYNQGKSPNELIIFYYSFIEVLTFFTVALLYPIFMRAKNEKPYNDKGAKQICKINTIWLIIITLVLCVLYKNYVGYGVIGILVFYSIAYRILTEETNSNKIEQTEHEIKIYNDSTKLEKEDDLIDNNSDEFDKKYKDLNKLKKLLDNNVITQEEFDEEKKKILK